ncbi:hypothetical protein [Blastococcus goldschmidtiae]|uniref:Uncharacterized protein n=1 Tax=Blastococcus goldschmidtiae TaxID=3075546 RepID=A0ABU2K6Y0_9ACTN|nr:hypothetical protein [Blastococcus sp. DSM 46792]MDT0275938.1 hypothetical protein [Blastococcus sp. DSM 46792]
MTAILMVTAEQLGRAVDAVQDGTGLADAMKMLANCSGRVCTATCPASPAARPGIAAMLLRALAEEAGADSPELVPGPGGPRRLASRLHGPRRVDRLAGDPGAD